MKLIKVRDQLTLERVNVFFTLNKEEIEYTSKNHDRIAEEHDEYKQMSKNIANKYKAVGDNSRQIVYADDTTCISFIQLLNREETTMTVVFRSSDACKLQSDLGFLCTLAWLYCVDELRVTINSLHIPLTNKVT